jgi:8-oxo-dGTP pyrophosphatase MutT (NUDIX family)
MADARAVLREAVEEAGLLATTGGSMEKLQALALLARKARWAGEGEVPDEEVRESGLHASGLSKLGLL